MEKVTYIWKIKISRPWTFDNDPDFVQFLTSTDVQILKCSPMFGFPWNNPSVNSQWYIKKMSALIWITAYNHNFGLYLVQLYKFCLEYSGYAFVSRASCDMQISLEMVSKAHVH